MPPTTTATEPFLRMRLKLPRVAGTDPIHAMKWRLGHRGRAKVQRARLTRRHSLDTLSQG
jgi:hypothetical protein